MNENVNFVGNGKELGNKIQITLKWDDIKRLWRWKNKSGKQYLSLDVIKRKTVSEWGHTHTVVEHKTLKAQEQKTG